MLPRALVRFAVSLLFLAAAVAGPLTIYAATLDGAFNPGADYPVWDLAVQTDGKILVGGEFNTLAGQSRNRIGRLNGDGSLDTTFDAGAAIGTIFPMALQTDGKILVGGKFTQLGGQTRNRIARLNADGSLDSVFDPGVTYAFSAAVWSLVVQPDGRILVGGTFDSLGGQPRRMIGRLNANGAVDLSFDPGANNRVNTVALQPDGKILLGGNFTQLGGQTRNRIGRLNADGTLDQSFDPGANQFVAVLAVQADGKILVGGDFTTLAGQVRNRIGRLNADGSLDADFDPGADVGVSSLAVQADGKMLVAGDFTALGGQTRNHIGRLNADGSLDMAFDPGANQGVNTGVGALALQADGKALVGGDYRTLSGQARTNLARLNASDPATQSLTCDGSTITWLRGGTAPEVWRTTFDASTNGGVRWFGLGDGLRLGGGWQLAGLTLPTNSTVRARGFATGGFGNGSSWFVETHAGVPFFLAQPSSRTNRTGELAAFSVVAGGSGPLSYQWWKDGAVLNDGVTILGTTTAALTLSNVLSSDAGGYFVVVSNISGSVTSSVAILTVGIPPTITQPPASLTVTQGQSAVFNVTAAGSAPLGYQWQFGGADIAGATQSALTILNAQAENAGPYAVVVANAYSALTSAVATLTVRIPPLITQQPTHRTVLLGEGTGFHVGATGDSPLGYQWFKDGAPIAGARFADYQIPSVQLADTGDYFCCGDQRGGHGHERGGPLGNPGRAQDSGGRTGGDGRLGNPPGIGPNLDGDRLPQWHDFLHLGRHGAVLRL